MTIGTPTLLKSANLGLTGQATLLFTIGATGASIGDLVYMVAGYGLASSPTLSVADSKSNTWTVERRDDRTTSATPHSLVAWSVLTTALVNTDTVTLTFGTNANYPMGSLYKSTGSWGSSPVDQKTGATSVAATSVSSGNITIATAAELLAAAICFGTSGIQSGFTQGSGWTAQNGLSATAKSFIDEYEITSSTGTYTATGTMSSSEYAVSLVSFKEAGGVAVKHNLLLLGVGT